MKAVTVKTDLYPEGRHLRRVRYNFGTILTQWEWFHLWARVFWLKAKQSARLSSTFFPFSCKFSLVFFVSRLNGNNARQPFNSRSMKSICPCCMQQDTVARTFVNTAARRGNTTPKMPAARSEYKSPQVAAGLWNVAWMKPPIIMCRFVVLSGCRVILSKRPTLMSIKR